LEAAFLNQLTDKLAPYGMVTVIIITLSTHARLGSLGYALLIRQEAVCTNTGNAAYGGVEGGSLSLRRYPGGDERISNHIRKLPPPRGGGFPLFE
jgi:hypothetical protein